MFGLKLNKYEYISRERDTTRHDSQPHAQHGQNQREWGSTPTLILLFSEAKRPSCFNPLGPHDALKHHFATLKMTYSLHLGVLERQFS